VLRVQFDEGRLDHLTKRATTDEIEQVFANGPQYQQNLRGRSPTTGRWAGPTQEDL
jgi:hypothetical protein